MRGLEDGYISAAVISLSDPLSVFKVEVLPSLCTKMYCFGKVFDSFACCPLIILIH